jgi:hypothetical protein
MVLSDSDGSVDFGVIVTAGGVAGVGTDGDVCAKAAEEVKRAAVMLIGTRNFMLVLLARFFQGYGHRTRFSGDCL